MNFYGVRELSNNTKTVLNSVSDNGTAVITDNGKPTAMLIGINEDMFDTVYAMVCNMRAQYSLNEIRKKAQRDFPNGMTMDEIDDEIRRARRGE